VPKRLSFRFRSNSVLSVHWFAVGSSPTPTKTASKNHLSATWKPTEHLVVFAVGVGFEYDKLQILCLNDYLFAFVQILCFQFIGLPWVLHPPPLKLPPKTIFRQPGSQPNILWCLRWGWDSNPQGLKATGSRDRRNPNSATPPLHGFMRISNGFMRILSIRLINV
jgi:hypothetical protein